MSKIKTYGLIGKSLKHSFSPNFFAAKFKHEQIKNTIYNTFELDEISGFKNLIKEIDFGQYADENGVMPVCFIASNHCTGGNSGSPVLNAKGELIGLNFDRNWEGTMSDINYDINQCRNISVDIRYVLFVVDKFANAGHLVKEMKLVKEENK